MPGSTGCVIENWMIERMIKMTQIKQFYILVLLLQTTWRDYMESTQQKQSVTILRQHNKWQI